ncbi:hypothetical protein D9M68_472090 [compost metagenome]
MAKVFQRQAVHVVAGGGGIQHVGFEHGVEGDAPHVDRRGSVDQHVHVVLAMLGDLGLVRVLEDRPERGEHGVAVQLRRHAHVAVRQRNVGGLALLHGEGHADQLRLLGVDAVGLGVEGDQLGGAQLLQPDVEVRLLQHGLVVRAGLDRRLVHIARALLLGLAQQVVQPVLEFQLLVEGDQRLALRFAGVQRVDLHIQHDVGLDGRQAVGEERLLAVFLELGRQGLGAADRQLRHLVQVLVEDVEAAADAGEQAQRGLLADAGDAGDVVDLVAHQREEIDDQLRTDTEFLFHAIHVEHATGHGVDQRNVPIDQLRHVLVAGGNHHRAIGRGAAAGQRADHVVGLHAFHAQQRQAQRAHAGMQRLDLHAQLVRHRRPIGLVLGEQLVAEGRPLGIEDHREGAVGVLLAQALEHVQHPFHRAGGLAGGSGQRRQGMEGAVEVRGTVYQDEGR